VQVAAGLSEPGGSSGAGGGRQVSLSISSLYSVDAGPGAWVPVTVSVTNRARADLRAQLVVTTPVSQMMESGDCYPSGAGDMCEVGGTFNVSPTFYQGPLTTVVTRRIPVELASGTTERLTIEALASSYQNKVAAEVLSGPGGALAKAAALLPVETGDDQPCVLVVTDHPAAMSSLSLPVPGGPQPQVQLLSPADLPAASAALGAFLAVVVDQADTGVLSAAQRRAVQGYVEAGGTLAVVGGAGWRAAVAGLPRGLLPARALGTTSMALPHLGRLLGEPPVEGRADVDRTVMANGGLTVLSEGATPLVARASRGAGYVVLSAVDPSAAPLATWPGNPALMSRLLAPAYQGAYYYQAWPEHDSIGLWPAVMGPALNRPGLMSPGLAGDALGTYLEQMLGTPAPSLVFLGLFVLCYVAIAGPVCFVVLGRLRRRELTWVVLPCTAVIAGLVAYLSGASTDRGPRSAEVLVAQMAPGSKLAQVSSLGAVYLPNGGSDQVTVAGPGPVGDLGTGAGQLTVSPGTAPGTSLLRVDGPARSTGGWAASEDATADGTLDASVQGPASALSGRVTNHLGVQLEDVYIVASGALKAVGTLPPGGSARFDLPMSSTIPEIVPPFPPHVASAAAARHEAAAQGLCLLANQYLEAGAARAVLVGLASTPFLPPGTGGDVAASRTVDAIVVPLSPAWPIVTGTSALPPELVGWSGVTEASAGPAFFVLGKGGYLDYQFPLPHRRWKSLELDLGLLSPPDWGTAAGIGVYSGPGKAATPGDFAASAYDYATSTWRPLGTSVVSRDARASIAQPTAYLGPAGLLEVRISALTADLAVFGWAPGLSAVPAAP
jgi:hypothetical protein